MNLTEIILNDQDIETLYDWAHRLNLTDIEREIQNRLTSCDPNIYNPIIDFLYNNRGDSIVAGWINSSYVQQGLISHLDCIPWKIGVVYDYRTESFSFNNIGIILGNRRWIRDKKGKIFKPSWLHSSKSGLVMRELVSLNTHPIKHISRVVNVSLDHTIRRLLLNNNNVVVTLCSGNGKSYDTLLPNNEIRELYPCNVGISGANSYNVPVERSEDVLKVFELIKQ